MKKTKNFFNLKKLKIAFGFLFIFSTHISTISISRNPVNKNEEDVNNNFLIINNFEISGINKFGKISVSDDIAKTLPNYIEFLYSKNDSEVYIKTPPINLSNGDRVNIKIFNKNDPDNADLANNKITITISGLPDSSIKPFNPNTKSKTLWFMFNNLKYIEWKISDEKHHSLKREEPQHNREISRFYEHSSSQIKEFQTYFHNNGIILIRFDLSNIINKLNFWIKFKKNDGTIYKFIVSDLKLKFIGAEDNKPFVLDSENSHPPTTSSSFNAIQAFTSSDSNLEKVDISIRKENEGSYGKIGLVKLNGKDTTYIINKKYELKGKTNYRIKFKIKPEFINTFFWNKMKELVIPFTTREQEWPGWEKPKIIDEDFEKPKTSSSRDGKYKFLLEDFLEDKMEVELVDKGVKEIRKIGNKWIVINLRSNERFKIKILFKKEFLDNNESPKGWKGSGIQDAFIINKVMREQTNIGIRKPYAVFQKVVQVPTTKSSNDGRLEFRLDRYGNNSKLEFWISSIDSIVEHELDGNKIVVNNLQGGEKLYINFRIKKINNYWIDGTKGTIKRILFNIPIAKTSGIEKPTIRFKDNSEISANTKTSEDGEMTFIIEGFDENTMNIDSSVGDISKIVSNQWKVFKLQSNDRVKISINLKPNNFWNTRNDLREEISFEKTTKEVIYEGIERVEIIEDTSTENRVIPRTFNSKDGELGLKIKLNGDFFDQRKILEFFENVDYEVIPLNLNTKTTLNETPLKIINLMDSQETKIILTPKKDKYWKDGKNEPIEFTLNAPTLNAIGINQPSIDDISIFKKPLSEVSEDGMIIIYLNNFNSNKMVLSSDVGEVQQNNRESSQKYISRIKSNQEVRITIKPKDGYAWNSGPNVKKTFKMAKILDFPERARSIQFIKENPSVIGGDGYVKVQKFVPITYGGETIEAAYLEYQENGIGEWMKVPYAEKIIGKNGLLVKFRWKLKDGYLWSRNSVSVIINPQDITLKNPGAASVPKIRIAIRDIMKPKGRGSISVDSFNANGASLYYMLDTEKQWHEISSRKSWEGKDGFKIHFKWVLNEGFVWDTNQPQKITNSLAELKDPIDLTPPKWKFKENISSDDFKIVKKSLEKYEANLKYYYGEKIPTNDILGLFKAMDQYGIYSHTEERNIFSTINKIEITRDNRNAIILSAIDLAGNRSELSINILIKYKIENLSNAKAHKVYFKNSFSNLGEIIVNSENTPKFIFKEHGSNNLFNINGKNIYAIYRVVDKNGNEIQWFTNQKEAITGWSIPDKESLNPFGKNYPKKLSNDQIIQIKFLPKEGYKIQDYTSKQEALLRENEPQFVVSSRIFEFKVEGLIEILEQSEQEPKFSFIGNDGQGKVELEPKNGSNVFEDKARYLLQVFRPYFPKNLDKNKEIVDNQENPIYGFEIYIPTKNGNMNNNDNWHLVSGVSKDFSDNVLEIEEVRKLWRDTRLSLKINNVSNMTNTLISANKINKLSNFYFLRIIEKAKDGWGYKHSSSNKVNSYPEEFTKIIIWNKTVGDLYFGIKVEKLSINPIVNILEETFSIVIKPSLENSYSYERDMQIILSYYPNRQNGDKFIWRYKILNKEDSIVSDWSKDFDTKNIENGYKLIVGYKALPPFTLSSKFKTMQRVFIIDGLKTKIDISTVPRPKVVFSGNVNYGTIKDLLEYNVGSKQLYDRNNGFPLPKTKHLESLKLKWQYRVFNSDPTKLIEKLSNALEKIAWIDDLPQELNNNQYVQVRVAPKNSEKYGVEPQVYSIDPKIDSSFIRVNGLEINWKLLHDISFEIRGDKNQNILKMLGSNKQKDFQANFDALIFEVKAEEGEIWRPISHLNNKLKNGMILSFRAYAKNPYLSHLPDSDLNEEIKLISGKKYLELSSWKKVAVNGLKTTIHFKHLSIKKPKLIAMKNTPWEIIKKDFRESVIPSGWAKIEGHVVDSQDLESAYYENGVIKNASEYVEVQYQLLEYDIRENKLVSQGWSTIAPTNLKNNDQIQIRVTPKDPKKFQLDWKRELIFKVENLYEDNKIIKIQAPTMIFSGIDGQGIAMPTISSIGIHVYFYQIYDENLKLIKNWSKDFPSKLKNGYYIKSRIIELKDDIDNPKQIFDESELQKVYGLFAEFSLQDLNTKMLLEIKVVGRINHKASLDINNQIVKSLEVIDYKIEYIVFNTENKEGKRFSDVPNNLSNGDKVEIEIVNKKTGISQDLKVIEKEFKGINVENLVDDEQHTKTLSKSIWIPIIIITSLLIVVTPIYLARRKRKLSV